MRRYASGLLHYGPGDRVLVAVGEARVWARIMSPPQETRDGTVVYRVSLLGDVRRLPAEAIIKQCDSGEPEGWVRHLEAGG